MDFTEKSLKDILKLFQKEGVDVEGVCKDFLDDHELSCATVETMKVKSQTDWNMEGLK